MFDTNKVIDNIKYTKLNILNRMLVITLSNTESTQSYTVHKERTIS